MALSEFSVIERFFSARPSVNPATQLGIGDDCAVLAVPKDSELVVTTDTMVEGVHFFSGADAKDLGHKLLAVNLSDIASMGARPFAVTLALTLPGIDEDWLQRFADGFFQLAECYSVDLVGGDTTSGPLTLTVQALGVVAKGRAVRRCSAKPGDLIYVTGYLGDAGLGLKIEQGYQCAGADQALARLHRPEPQVKVGLVISDYATACIDVSDGLASDLGHILQQSQVGACLNWDRLPFSAAVKRYIDASDDWRMPLCAGDDYELCFTVSPDNSTALEAELTRQALTFYKIGTISDQPGLLLNRRDQVNAFKEKGYEHFTLIRDPTTAQSTSS